MPVYRAEFDDSKQGQAGRWRPMGRYGEDVILFEHVLLEESGDGKTVVEFIVPAPECTRLEMALDANPEVICWDRR